MKYRAQIILAVLLVVASCTSAEDPGKQTPRVRGEQEIFAAIVGFEAAQPPRAGELPAKILFVAVGQTADMQDPVASILPMIAPGGVKVEPYSACEFQSGGIIDQKTGARGDLIQLGPVMWETDDQASADASVWIASGVGLKYVFHLAKKDGKWVVVDHQPLGAA